MDCLTFDTIITRFTGWTKAQKEIDAALMIGSRARTDEPADEWSDLDIIFLTSKPEQFIHSEHWLNQIHPYSITFLEKTAVGNGIERRVMFDPHLDVDFVILTPEHFSGMLQLMETHQVLNKGYKVLFDKTDVLNGIKVSDDLSQPHMLPTQAQYDNLVQYFWYHVVWVSKKMLRGEIWVAKECLGQQPEKSPSDDGPKSQRVVMRACPIIIQRSKTVASCNETVSENNSKVKTRSEL